MDEFSGYICIYTYVFGEDSFQTLYQMLCPNVIKLLQTDCPKLFIN